MNFYAKAAGVLRHLGPRWAIFRAQYATGRRLGQLRRRMPVREWSQIDVPAATGARFFADRPNVARSVVDRAEAILSGRFELFSWRRTDPEFPPRWHANPFAACVVPGTKSVGHWSTFPTFAAGDIKGIWELSRFAWAFDLARAYAFTGDEGFAEGFWTLFEDWMRHNPPNRGPNWMCGQEATFRLMGATFARFVCDHAAATSAARREAFARFVSATGRRIDGNLEYALSQSNNHGISECVGLITSGLLVSTREQARWLERGMKAFKRQVADLVYSDGGFSQHSAVYHRVMLHDLLWCATLLLQSGREVPVWLLEAGKRAVDFLAALVDPATGRAPLYGANDGANVLPLSESEFLDFRPVLQAGYVVFHGRPVLPLGPWDEAAGWLGGRKSEVGGQRTEVGARKSEVGQTTPFVRHFPDAGCLVWQRGDFRGFFRCPTRFRHRPSQADLLHVSLDWRGYPIAIDAGSYSYNAEGPFAGALKSAAVHNTVTFDGAEPMQKVGRFLYLPWPRGHARWADGGEAFVASHDGWDRHGVSHTRFVQLREGDLVVRDRVSSRAPHQARLHWLLSDLPYEFDGVARRLVLRTAAGAVSFQWSTGEATLIRADPNSGRGWWSPYYFRAEPALSLAVSFPCSGTAEMETRVVST